MNTYIFKVLGKNYKVKACDAGDAMVHMNRNVMDKLGIFNFAWMDDVKPNTYYASNGNYWD
jgi:hypothetical protein